MKNIAWDAAGVGWCAALTITHLVNALFLGRWSDWLFVVLFLLLGWWFWHGMKRGMKQERVRAVTEKTWADIGF